MYVLQAPHDVGITSRQNIMMEPDVGSWALHGPVCTVVIVGSACILCCMQAVGIGHGQVCCESWGPAMLGVSVRVAGPPIMGPKTALPNAAPSSIAHGCAFAMGRILRFRLLFGSIFNLLFVPKRRCVAFWRSLPGCSLAKQRSYKF